MKILKEIIFLSLFLVAYSSVSGQVKYCGKDFFFSLGGANSPDTNYIPASYDNSYNVCYVQLASAHTTAVRFFYKQTGVTNTYALVPNVPLTVALTEAEVNAIVDKAVEVVRNRSVEITSDSDITVGFLGGEGGAGDDAMMILPCDEQKKSDTYSLLGTNSNIYAEPFTFSIVATCDNVVLQITPQGNTYSHATNVPYTITMNKGQDYRIGTPAILGPMPCTNDDITGSIIKVISAPSCFPIEVFITYDDLYTTWPVSPAPPACCADLLTEQIVPQNWWDTTYPVAPFQYDSLTVIRILSGTNGNTIYYNHHAIKTLNAGAHYDTILLQDEPAVISASYPIGVAEFSISCSFDSSTEDGDPSMLWDYSIQQGLKNAVFQPYPRTVGMYNPVYEWLAIICKTPDTAGIMLNNVNISNQFYTFPADPTYSYAEVWLQMSTIYHLVAPKNVIAYHYEEEEYGAYNTPLADLLFHYDTGLVKKADTLHKCPGGTIMLTADAAENYQWSTGDTTQTITVSAPGTYTVTSITQSSCVNTKAEDDFYIVVADTTRIATAQKKCAGVSAVIEGDAATTYKWSTGDTTQNITVTEAGSYSVLELLNDSCHTPVLHSFEITDVSYPGITVGNDTTICSGDTILLHVAYDDAVWSTGATGPSISVSSDGTYYVSATDSCNVVHSDTISVKTHVCTERYCILEFPNAFTPNGDNHDDLFRPVYNGVFSDYKLNVYNRWGQIVYTSNDITAGWDGLLDGTKAEMGTYFFYCTFKCPAKGNIQLKGDVTLIR